MSLKFVNALNTNLTLVLKKLSFNRKYYKDEYFKLILKPNQISSQYPRSLFQERVEVTDGQSKSYNFSLRKSGNYVYTFYEDLKKSFQIFSVVNTLSGSEEPELGRASVKFILIDDIPTYLSHDNGEFSEKINSNKTYNFEVDSNYLLSRGNDKIKFTLNNYEKSMIILTPNFLYFPINNGNPVRNEFFQKDFDILKYSGEWFNYASIVQFYDRDCAVSVANYTLLQDGTANVLNSCYSEKMELKRKVSGKITVSKFNTAALFVNFPDQPKFEEPVSNFRNSPNYLVHETDYRSYAIVGSSNRQSLFILVRKNSNFPNDKYFLKKIMSYGYTFKNKNFRFNQLPFEKKKTVGG